MMFSLVAMCVPHYRVWLMVQPCGRESQNTELEVISFSDGLRIGHSSKSVVIP